MKRTSFVFILIIAFFCADAQSKMIKEVFRRLPANEVYNLTVNTRDSMLKGKTYYPSDNDSNSIQAYNYGYSPFVEDYMYISMSFETDKARKKRHGSNLKTTSRRKNGRSMIYTGNKFLIFCVRCMLMTKNQITVKQLLSISKPLNLARVIVYHNQ